MQKKKNKPAETENETCREHSENLIENEKYLRKRELQRALLNKLVGSAKTTVLSDNASALPQDKPSKLSPNK